MMMLMGLAQLATVCWVSGCCCFRGRAGGIAGLHIDQRTVVYHYGVAVNGRLRTVGDGARVVVTAAAADDGR